MTEEKKRQGKVKSIVTSYLPILIILVLWEAIVRSGLVNEQLLPPLSAILLEWMKLVRTGEMGQHAFASLWRGFAGFTISVFIGVFLGIGMAWYRGIRNFFEPLVNITYPLPKLALISIVMIWLGDGDASKILVIILGCILPVIINSFNGARGVDRFLIWSARNMGTRNRRLLWKIVIPAALPDILSGIRVALATAFLMLVGSEMLGGNRGLGFLIFFLGEGGVYTGMFASVITLTLIGFAADRLYVKFMNRVLLWKEE